MDVNKIHGCWHRCCGFSRELWGEITGNEGLFTEGLHQRMVGRMESYRNMCHTDAEQQVNQLTK